MMTTNNHRPSLDVLVPLVMIEDNITDENNDDLSCESPKEILRHFESGDIVLIRLDSQCLPAIVFNMNGFVMKFDIDRQLYHVCLLDKEFTEQWVDATDMIIYSVPMIAECQNEQTMLMWSTANELLDIPNNNNDDKRRLEEFKRRFSETKHQQLPLSSMNNSRKTNKSRCSNQKTTCQSILSCSLTTCEELHIIETIYRLSQCTYNEAKRIAEETYLKIVCTNNRENVQSYSIDSLPDQWFLTFAIRQINHLKQYSSNWLPELETMIENLENESQLSSLISLMKQSV